MVELSDAFEHLSPTKILVAGDLLLDTYTVGKSRRISPEAPVAVVHVEKEEERPGGAGNVMLNLLSMGADVVALGRVGDDLAGMRTEQALAKERVDTSGVLTQKGLTTPVKNRIIASGQQIVRVDREEISPIPEVLEQRMIEMLPKLLAGVKLVAISDYGKGLLSRTLLAALIDQADAQKIPVIVDPKGSDFSKYRGATLIKPNQAETYAAANLQTDAPLEQAAARLLQQTHAATLMVTRSEAGISLYYPDHEPETFPVQVREVRDVTGAGDTVLAMLSCALSNGLSLAEATQLSNIAAGIAIEQFGCARVTLSEVARWLLKHDAATKVYDSQHLFALREALRNHPYIVLEIPSSEEFSSSLYKTIRALHAKGKDLMIYLQGDKKDEELTQLLASLHEVDFIVQDESLFDAICRLVPPASAHAFTAAESVTLS